MKKITFILFALIVGTGFAQESAIGQATVNAVIVSPISIESSGVLDFAKIARTTAGGYITLSPTGVPTFEDSEMEIVSNTYTVPTFTVSAEEGETYKVVTAGGVLNGTTTGDEITLRDITTSLSGNTGNSDTSFTVGGTIDVGATQGSGSYSGQLSVTVSYE